MNHSLQPHPSIWTYLSFRVSPERIKALQEALARQIKENGKVSAKGEYKDLGVAWDRLCWAKWRIPNSPISTVLALESGPKIHLDIGEGTTGLRLNDEFEISFRTASGEVCGILHNETLRDISDVFRKAMRHFSKRCKSQSAITSITNSGSPIDP